MKWTYLIAIFFGGGLGSLLRFLTSRLTLTFQSDSKFPLATFAANVLACCVMITVVVINQKYKVLSEEWKMFWLVGVCGGFSTFSTFSYENWILYREGFYLTLIGNVLISVAACFLIFWAGSRLFIASN